MHYFKWYSPIECKLPCVHWFHCKILSMVIYCKILPCKMLTAFYITEQVKMREATFTPLSSSAVVQISHINCELALDIVTSPTQSLTLQCIRWPGCWKQWERTYHHSHSSVRPHVLTARERNEWKAHCLFYHLWILWHAPAVLYLASKQSAIEENKPVFISSSESVTCLSYFFLFSAHSMKMFFSLLDSSM